MHAIALVAIYLGVVGLPIVLAWMAGLPPRSFLQDLSSALGMLAFAAILAEFVLSGRFRAVSRGIGLDVTIRFHQLMGRGALGFALVHPFLYRRFGAPLDPSDVTRQFSVTGDLSLLWTGIAAFLILPIFVMASINRDQLDYRYEGWRLLHGLGALALAGLLWHHTVYAGRYAAEPALVWYWSAMTGVAVLSLVFVYVLKPLIQSRHPWRVSEIHRLTPRQWHVQIAPLGHAGARYKAGQFVWLNLGHSPFSLVEHPFSISSAPASGPELGFVIKELGDFTSRLDEISPGDRAYVDGPYGTLTLEGRTEAGVGLIAGGVGLAPMIGVLREMQLSDDPRPRTLIYGNRSESQIAHRAELTRLAQDRRTEVVHVLSEPPEVWPGERGLIDSALLRATFDQTARATWVFLLCGPPEMMTNVEEALIAQGVSPSRILSERFRYD